MQEVDWYGENVFEKNTETWSRGSDEEGHGGARGTGPDGACDLQGDTSGENHRHSSSAHRESVGTKYHHSKELTVTMWSIMCHR